MAADAKRAISIVYTGDVIGNQFLPATDNPTSPAQVDFISLAMGDNTINVPAGAIGVTIVPPFANTVVLTLKGAGGDTGVIISPTDPSSIGLPVGASSFILNASASLSGLRTFWT